MSPWLFIPLFIVSVTGALLVILHRNPLKSALALIVVMFALAILYLAMSASFLAIIQVMVYAGAVMVLFLFVLFLLNVGVEGPFSTRPLRRAIAGLTGVLMGLLLAGVVVTGLGPAAPARQPEGMGTIEAAGEILFTRYLLPFELLGILLLVAVIGAVVASRPRWPVYPLPEELWPREDERRPGREEGP